MKIKMDVEVLNEKCIGCKDFDADVISVMKTGMETYEDAPVKENVTYINAIRCSHYYDCKYRSENIFGCKCDGACEKKTAAKKTPVKKTTATKNVAKTTKTTDKKETAKK